MFIFRYCTSILIRRFQNKQILPSTICFETISHWSGNNNSKNYAFHRNYKHFKDKIAKAYKYSKYIYLFIGTLFLSTIILSFKIRKTINKKEPLKLDFQDNNNGNSDNFNEHSDSDSDSNRNDKKSDSKDKKKKGSRRSRASFREEKIRAYEDRLRKFSTHRKLFSYFASVHMPRPDEEESRKKRFKRSEIFMTPIDFFRAITPGMTQPEGLGLDRYRQYNAMKIEKQMKTYLKDDSIFYEILSNELISFSDYVFLIFALSTSEKNLRTALLIFDLNQDGEIDYEEFKQVAKMLGQVSNTDNRKLVTNSSSSTVHSSLKEYFFGPKLNKKLTIQKFLIFQQRLQKEIAIWEFERKQPNEAGNITEVDFAKLILTYSGFSPQKEKKKLKRIKKKFRKSEKGISLIDFLNFFHIIKYINEIDTALTFYHFADISIDQATFKHVAKTVAHADLSDHLIDVIFTIFDDNMDGHLNRKEFVAVMIERGLRRFEKRKNISSFKLFINSIYKCAKIKSSQ